MPRRKFVDRLSRICLINVAKHMDDIWCADYAKNFLDEGNFLYLVGPFDGLTSEHIQELINILSSRKWMKRYYLHLLIDNRLESLDLSVCRTVANKDSIINLVRQRCEKIKLLNIAYCNQVSSRIIADVVNSASNIQVLNLQRTKCNDQVLSLIGHKLPNIKDLNVSSCPVTDMGVMSLCVSFDPSFMKCGKLLKLDISNTAVSSKGAQRAVEHLPNLALLEFPDICDVVYHSRKECLVYEHSPESLPKDQLFRLRLLTISQMQFGKSNVPAPSVHDTVRVSVLVCPYITEVHFMRGATNECVESLSPLEHLRVAHIGNSDDELITFEDGILPMLTARGELLEDLSLHEVNNIDLGAVAACCPHLKKFSCIVAGYPNAQFPIHTHPEIIVNMQHKAFTKLEHVKVLLHAPANTFPPQYVKLLTVNAVKLQSLHFAYVQSLTDTVLDYILDGNSMAHLEVFQLEQCHELTGSSIRRLIDVSEQMKSLGLKYCKGIPVDNYSQFCKLCADNNYEMNIEWL